MQVTILQENIKKALGFINRIVTNKTQLPVLANVLLETETGRLKITATNLETSISYWVGATIVNPGSITVPARFLFDLVTSFTFDKVELTLHERTLEIKCGKSQASLAGIDAKEFPPPPQISPKKELSLTRKELEESLPFVLIAASSDDSKPLLTGINMCEKDGQLRLVATDGYRLSIKQLTQTIQEGEGLVLSAKALAEAQRLLTEEKAAQLDLFLTSDKNQLVLVLEKAQIATRLIEGQYPPYEKIIPQNFLSRTVFNKQNLLQAVKMASIYARESAYIIKLNVNNNLALVSANTPQIGKTQTEIDVETEGEGGEMAFNARFLLDLLNVFPEDEVVLEMNGPLAPGVFKPVKDQSYLHIIMPVRVQE